MTLSETNKINNLRKKNPISLLTMALKQIILVLLYVVVSANSWAINYFEGADRTGTSIGVAGQEDECVNIPTGFVGRSLDMRNFCVTLYDQNNCAGTEYTFTPESNNWRDLQKVSPKRIASITACKINY